MNADADGSDAVAMGEGDTVEGDGVAALTAAGDGDEFADFVSVFTGVGVVECEAADFVSVFTGVAVAAGCAACAAAAVDDTDLAASARTAVNPPLLLAGFSAAAVDADIGFGDDGEGEDAVMRLVITCCTLSDFGGSFGVSDTAAGDGDTAVLRLTEVVVELLTVV